MTGPEQLLVAKLLCSPAKHISVARLAPNKFPVAADLLTGADLPGGEDADSDMSHPDESASGDSMSAAREDAEQEDEDAAMDDIATAKGNHKRREDKQLLPTEDKFVSCTSPLPLHLCPCERVGSGAEKGLSMSGW